MGSKIYSIVLVSLTAICFAINPGQALAVTLVSSTFDTDGEGWTIFQDGTNFTHHATGGNPGGYISVDDLELGQTWFFAAPAKFLGNQSAAFGGSLQFDSSMAGDPTAPRINQPDARLIDSDSGLNLVFDASPDPSFFPIWTSYSIPLIASAGWKVGNLAGPVATDAQLLTALSSLDVLRIRGEFISGGDPPDTGSLDNVRLVQPSSVPEPASALLMGLGGLSWIFRRRLGIAGLAAISRAQGN